MRILCFAIVAFVVVHKLWASAETKWELLMNRMRTEPRSRTNPMRRGASMQTQIVQTNLAPETVWGVEVFDPLQQRAWAEALWQRWYHAGERRKPLLLVYQPSAERAAMRALNTLVRLSRAEECAPWVVLVEPQSGYSLAPPVPALSLYVLHRASRFANVKAWLTQAARSSACRVVLTAPNEEVHMLGAVADFEVVEIPAEETSYCDAVAEEILAKHFGALPPVGEPLSMLERILIAAGIAELALPINLLARQLQCEATKLCETISRSRLRELVVFAAETGTIAFRGAWLARKLWPEAQSTACQTLNELITNVNTQSLRERFFLLQLLLAARARGRAEEVLAQHAETFRQARQCAREGEERQAWIALMKVADHNWS